MCRSAECSCGCQGAPPLGNRRREVHVFMDFSRPPRPPALLIEPRLITSQTYVSTGRVNEKIEAEDFDVLVSPVFYVEGHPYRVVMNGHHALRAAAISGARPVLREAGMEHGLTAALAAGDVVGGLRHQHQKMGPYRDAITGEIIWERGSPYFMEA